MINNMIIGMGNTGSNIVKAASECDELSDVDMYCIDSVTSNVNLDMINRINIIPIISDEKSGSGRNRERGASMYQFHEANGDFDKMYENAGKAKSPVLVITSAAGGTGSGATVPLCKALIDKAIHVIPIIVMPSMSDPDAYHLNTNDLLYELAEVGVKTYAIFRNKADDACYASVNNEVVDLIQIIFGKKYGETYNDTIDDSDLDVVLSWPGRFIALSASAPNIESLKKELTRKLLSTFQQAWSENYEKTPVSTLVTAYSLTSMYADAEYKEVFSDIKSRFGNWYDEYKNICCSDNNGMCTATIIIAGLPGVEIKQISSTFIEASSIGAGITRSKRPDFLKKKKATILHEKSSDNSAQDVINKYNWK